MLTTMQGLRINDLAEVLKTLPTVAATFQDYAEIFQAKYKEMTAAQQTLAIHSELVRTDGNQRAQKVKGFIVSGLPIRMDDAFYGFGIPYLISEVDKIEIIKLMLEYNIAQFNEWASHRTGREIESNISGALDERTVRALHAEGKKGYLRIAGKTSVFDFVLDNAIATVEVNFLKFLVTELPEAFHLSPEAIGIAIESRVAGFHACPSEQSLRAIEYLTREVPANSKPELYWLNKAKEHCKKKITNSWFSKEEKDRITRLVAILG